MRIATQEFGENEKFRKLQTATYSYETSVFTSRVADWSEKGFRGGGGGGGSDN